MISILSLLNTQIVYRYYILLTQKLTLIVSWIFHSPDLLSLFVVSPKYGLKFLTYCLIDV